MSFLENLEIGTLKVGKLLTAARTGLLATDLDQPARVRRVIVGPILDQRITDGDTNMVLVPAGFVVTSVDHQVIVASGAGTQAITMGDATDPDGWDTTVNGKASAGTIVTGDGAYAAAALIAPSYGKLYATATYLTTSTDITTPAGAGGTHRLIVYGYQT